MGKSRYTEWKLSAQTRMERMNLMTAYPQMTAQERKEEYARVPGRFERAQGPGPQAEHGRGKPGKEQLDMVSDIFHLMQNPEDYVSDGIDIRNYGEMSGLPAAKRLFAEIPGCRPEQCVRGRQRQLAADVRHSLQGLHPRSAPQPPAPGARRGRSSGSVPPPAMTATSRSLSPSALRWSPSP